MAFPGVNKGTFNTMVQKLNFRVHVKINVYTCCTHVAAPPGTVAAFVCNTQSGLEATVCRLKSQHKMSIDYVATILKSGLKPIIHGLFSTLNWLLFFLNNRFCFQTITAKKRLNDSYTSKWRMHLGLPSSTDGNLLFTVLLNSAKDNFFSNSVLQCMSRQLFLLYHLDLYSSCEKGRRPPKHPAAPEQLLPS